MTKKVKSLEEELVDVKANLNASKAKDKPCKDRKIQEYFKCEICDYNTEKEITLTKHRNTKNVLFKCTECGKDFKSQINLENHVNNDHLKKKSTYNQIDEDNTCPICSKGFISKENMQEHFKENHMNPIDSQKQQTLSALITDEAKEMVMRTKTDEMTPEDYDKLLDKHEALYATDNEESANSDSEPSMCVILTLATFVAV